MISARRYLLAAALASGSVVLAACGSSSSAKSARLLAASANPTPATITAQIHGAHPPAWPSCRANTIKNIPIPDNATPIRSSR